MTQVFFAIPLAGKRSDESWRDSCGYLSQTLRSILAQTDPDFAVLVAGHERPEIPEIDDPRVTFLPATFEKPHSPEFYMRDKSRKKKMNAREIKKRGGGFMVLCDADDIASNRIVEYVRQHDHPNGYLFTKGWIRDFPTGNIAPIPGAKPGSFDQTCGSCAVLRLRPEDIGDSEDEHKASWFGKFGNHKQIGVTAAESGRPLMACDDFRAFIYVVNTGRSYMDGLYGAAEKARKVAASIERMAVGLTPELADEFALGPPRIAPAATFALDAQAAMLNAALDPSPEIAARQRKQITAALEGALMDHVERLRPPLIIEVGAHEAHFSIAIKQRLPSTRVIAIEAHPEVFAKYQQAVTGAGVEFHNACVAAEPGKATLKVPLKGANQRRTMGSVLADVQAKEFAEYEVEAFPLDSFAQVQPNVLWIDVEGAVAPVLDGGTEMLKRCLALYVEVETRQRWAGQITADGVIERLARFGLKPVLRDAAREWQHNLLFLR